MVISPLAVNISIASDEEHAARDEFIFVKSYVPALYCVIVGLIPPTLPDKPVPAILINGSDANVVLTSNVPCE